MQDLVKLIDLAGDEKEHEMLLENAYSKQSSSMGPPVYALRGNQHFVIKVRERMFRWKNQRRRQDQSPFKSERAELKKMELPGDEISFYGYEGQKYAICCYFNESTNSQ